MWLWPPASLRALHLFPRAHPCSRQSMIARTGGAGSGPEAASAAALPLRRLFPSERSPYEWPERVEVVIEPGDALFIPAFWAHAVSAIAGGASERRVRRAPWALVLAKPARCIPAAVDARL